MLETGLYRLQRGERGGIVPAGLLHQVGFGLAIDQAPAQRIVVEQRAGERRPSIRAPAAGRRRSACARL